MPIHPTAVVEPGARVAEDATVGPLCYVASKATIGSGTRLVSHVAVLGRTTLGSGNTVWPQATLGAAPQDLKYRGEDSELVIGDDNQIHESVTLHLGTANGGGVTRVGSHNMLMVGCHVAHDCVLADRIIIANNVHLAGHVHIEQGANIGGVVGVHHFVTIGRHAMVGGMTRLIHDAPPFMIAEGNPSEVRGVNVIGLERKGFKPETINRIKTAYRRLYRRGAAEVGGDGGRASAPAGGMTMAQRLVELETEFGDDECIRMLVAFHRDMAASPFGRYRETLRQDERRRGAGAATGAPIPVAEPAAR